MPMPRALWGMYSNLLSSRLTRGRRSTPRTRLKMAALAPMPSANVTITVKASPLARPSERRANFISRRKVIGSLARLADLRRFQYKTWSYYIPGGAGDLVAYSPRAFRYQAQAERPYRRAVEEL